VSDRPEHPVRKLTVTSCEVKATGKSKKTGNDWTLYSVAAMTEAGEPVEAELKSFSNLTAFIGKLEEYELEKQEDPKYGTSFLLKMKRGNLAPRLDMLEARVAELERLVRTLSSGLQSGDRPVDLGAGAGVPAGF
jgi:hypothetical protein